MYIITGGAGFIGSAMLWELNRHGIENVIIVDNLAHSEKWKNLVGLRYTEYIHRDDFEDMLKTGKALWRPKGVIHLGACSSTTETNADFLMKNNFEYSRLVCKYALHHGARFINASSAATYGDGTQGFNDGYGKIENLRPLNMYGYSKQLFDLWAKREKLQEKIVSLKFFNVYGPNEYHKGDMMSVASKAFKQISEGNPLKLFKSYNPKYENGCQMRDFVYIKDCTRIMFNLLENSGVNGLFNLGSGKSRSWLDLAKAVFVAMDKKLNVEFIEMPDSLKEKYQYFTEANMQSLHSKGQEFLPTFDLESGVKDYIVNYLATDNKYLSV
ncbi:ADP-glyceromanno-heptose 6-epimerase [Desulfovibrio litoralis]|uniref:ADP-L-glycero-D-manno-heptose-6-epimerase n=1 Tax=Desulfovibrio litoralis DSM 11393 TaxID=1121455 RepID=A0A1M7RXY9_9BACT|nr:ADP-glyceromanno-heptose 6-epimerase [Desulfovibrio litoralis]SHN51189.1 ADP-glyceromanno-heptose 6-epimerase precursor [Desulfovibrio litoralis DSM 11393]